MPDGHPILTEPFGSISIDIRPLNAYFKIELNGSVKNWYSPPIEMQRPWAAAPKLEMDANDNC
jgi:hypothetical protein